MTATAVLASGGLDSAALLAETASVGVAYPIYVEAGMVWESGEKASLERFVAALDSPNVRPTTYLSLQVAPLLAGHWSVTGQGIPDSDAPDEEMYIPGRNILLIGLAAVWCSTHGVNRVVIGSLGSNPFPDATPSLLHFVFRGAEQRAESQDRRRGAVSRFAQGRPDPQVSAFAD